MVGRTPEYLGKKIQAAEMKLVVLYILVVPLVVLGFSAVSVAARLGSRRSILNPGPHGFTEIIYAFTSAANNNGSAFGGLTANTDWLNTTLGIAMLVGRFFLIIPRWRSPARSPASRRSRRRPARSRPHAAVPGCSSASWSSSSG